MKTREEIKDKLRKLFAMMAEGSGASEQETQTAMVKARKLMAEYKLSEKDIQIKEQEVISRSFDISYTTKTNPWVNKLVNVIASNYCCHACMYSKYHSSTKQAGIIGFEEDVEIAGRILNYAIDYIFTEHRKIRSSTSKKGATFSDGTAMCNAYGNGFVKGLADKFEEQNIKEMSTGFSMVMVEPQEVKDYIKKLHAVCFNTSKATQAARKYDEYAVKGYRAGKDFNTSERIAG